MPQNRRKKGSKKTKSRKGGKRRKAPLYSSVGTGFICPPHQIVRLGYPSEFQLSTAGTVLAKRFYTNGALAPEVSVATKPNGFAQLATLYNQYRVLKYHYKFYVTNNETFPLYVYCVNSNSDPGTGATGTVIGRPNAQFRELSAKGGMDKAILTGGYTINHIVGQNTTIDDKYSALANALPADTTWLACGSQSSGGANLTNGSYWFGLITLVVKFYDRLPL